MSRSLKWMLGAAMVVAVGCGDQADTPAVRAVASSHPEQPAQPDEPPLPGPAAHTLRSEARTGSTVQLARLAGRDIVLVADEDAHALRVIDAESLEEQSHVPLDGRPAQLVIAGDGRVHVALRDRNQVVALEARTEDARSWEQVAVLEVATEPVALATSPNDNDLFVSSAWGRRLARYDLTSGARTLDVALAREPRGVVVTDDASTAFVVHAIGARISRVALSQNEVVETSLAGSDFATTGGGCIVSTVRQRRDAVQGFAVALVDGCVVAGEVLAHREDIPTGGYGSTGGYPTHQPALAIIDGEHTWLRVANQAFRADRSREAPAGGDQRAGCLLPRAIIADPASRTALVGCMGTDEVRVIDTDTQTGLNHGTLARWHVPSGPSGIALDIVRRRAIVWSQLARDLSVVSLVDPALAMMNASRPRHGLPTPRPATSVVHLGPLANERPRWSAAAQEGRRLFHTGDGRISDDGRSCASCHPDGRDDGLTWGTPSGARQTPMLAGRLDQRLVPFGWQGDAATIQAHLKQTFTRLGGQGLDDEDTDAIVAYCREMDTPAPAATTEPLVATGKALFFADKVGCATCHTDGGGSDGQRHDVGSGPKLDTPSLRFVAGTAPYFHDGRYATLADLLTHTKGTMGWGNELSTTELQALEAYLLTL